MIARLWHGWTTPDRADEYENLLKTEIFPGIEAKGVEGFREIQLFRRPREEEGDVEFVTVMWFDDLMAVKQFAGEDYEKAYVPDAARHVLAGWDTRSAHYEIRAREEYGV